MLDAHSEALQNSTCCRPWVPGWCHPSVHQSLQSQRYLASIAWCQMILAHVLDFLCTSDDPCTCSGLSLHRLETIFVHAIHCAASFYLRHGSKIVRTICRGSSYLIKTLAYLVLTLPWLWAMLLHFFWYPLPWSNNFAACSHGHILVTWELDAGVYLGVCWICSERRSSCNVKAKALRASQLKDVKGKNLGHWHQGRVWSFLPRHRKQCQSKSRCPQATDLQPNLFGESKHVNYFEFICWFMMIYVWRVPCKKDEYDRLSDTSSISSVHDSDASLLEVKRLTLQLKETLPFEI